MNNLITTINYIVGRSTELKDKFTNASSAPVEFLCIFCQNEEEYKQFTRSIETAGKIVQRTPSGFTYLLEKSIETIAGPLRLVKVRKPDPQRLERGDADFNTEYKNFKKTYQGPILVMPVNPATRDKFRAHGVIHFCRQEDVAKKLREILGF